MMGIEKKVSERQETLTKLKNDKSCRELARQELYPVSRRTNQGKAERMNASVQHISERRQLKPDLHIP
jgi:hypothetical protein